MTFGTKVCDLGSIRVADLRPHQQHGVIAYLDVQFEIVGSALERELAPLAERTEGIDMFVVGVRKDIEQYTIQEGQANAKVLFDASVKNTKRARKCLAIFLDAIVDHLTGIDGSTKARLTHDIRQDIAEAQASSWNPLGANQD